MLHKLFRLLVFTLAIRTPVLAIEIRTPETQEDEQAILDQYLLPDGELKDTLDELFTTYKLAQSFGNGTSVRTKDAFRKAGFKFLKGTRITEHPLMPGWVVKLGRANRVHQHVSRIWMAEAMRAVIQEHDLTHVKIPEKFLYHIPGTPQKLVDDNYAVISEKVECSNDRNNRARLRQLPFQTLNEIVTIIKNVVYNDPSPSNIRVLGDGATVAIIDTEIIHWKRGWDVARCIKQFVTYLSLEQKVAIAKSR